MEHEKESDTTCDYGSSDDEEDLLNEDTDNASRQHNVRGPFTKRQRKYMIRFDALSKVVSSIPSSY